MSPDRKVFLPLLAVALVAAACTDSEPPIVCKSAGTNYTSRVTITKTAKGEDREETINLNPAFLKNGVGVVNSADEQCGVSMTEFYSDPNMGIVVNGSISERGSERIVSWHTTIDPTSLNRLNPTTLNVTMQDGKVFFYRPYLSGWKTEIGVPKLPSDVLSEQVLQQSHIKIYQGKETQLHLRSNVFEISLFKDARDGKFAGLSIVLVDADNLSPESLQTVPEEFRGHYDIYRKAVQEKSKRLNEELVGLEEYRNKEEEEFNKGLMTPESYESVKKFYEAEKAKILEKIDKNQKAPLGLFMDGRKAKEVKPEWFQDQPGLAEGITIYLAVGGDFKPQPTQSHPKREQFPEQEGDLLLRLLTNGYRIKTESATPGYTIHHEVSHYGDKSEYEADTEALERISNGLYPFIFVNSNGLTYTKRLPVLRGEGLNQPSLVSSFEQRFNPHKFTANGVLKPRYAPKKLGV